MLGEHTVLHGSAAYAVPLHQFSARVEMEGIRAEKHSLPTEIGIHSSFDFAAWLAFAKTKEVLSKVINFARWEQEAPHLRVYSDIPIGFGLGSSGAITAALYTRYSNQPPENLPILREQLAALEGYFHGKSSGLDPLVSFLDKAIYISPTGEIEAVESQQAFPRFHQEGAWFLLNSGQPRAGKEAITRFGESCKNESWRKRFLFPMSELVEELTTGLKSQNIAGLSPKLEALSRIQLHALDFLIPDHISILWEKWQANGTAHLKLCGAGGGGFFLGYTRNRSNMSHEVIWL